MSQEIFQEAIKINKVAILSSKIDEAIKKVIRYFAENTVVTG